MLTTEHAHRVFGDCGATYVEVVAAMSEPAFYGTDSVEHIETHVSDVFLAGDRVFKLKKPVTLPFADLATLERRRVVCQEEVRLNRRLAADVYIGVRAIVVRNGVFEVADADERGAVEYAVEMRRLDERCSLAALLDGGQAGVPEIAAVARRVAQFHRHAELVAPDAALAMLEKSADETYATLEEVTAPVLRAEALAAKRFSSSFRASHAEELRDRAQRGLFRDGHGDLRLEHVFLNGEEVTVIDCAELAPRLRQIDVGADLSFLVMELELRGATALAGALVAAYRSAGGDPGSDSLIAFHAAERAWIRAKVALIRANEMPYASADAGEKLAEAKALATAGKRLAWRARRPALLIVCGGAATGKSTLAAELVAVSGLPVLNSDLVRKRRAGLVSTERGGPSLYGSAANAVTYAELGRLAADAATLGNGAIVDATFRRRVDREAFAAALGSAAAPVFLECRASAEVVAERALKREADPNRVSDATLAVAVQQLSEFEPLDEVDSRRHAVLDTTLPSAEVVHAVERLLDSP
jgi:aminoglycoside phosphotransferase family enzyme/predicted kinase